MDVKQAATVAASSSSDAPSILGALGALRTGGFYLVVLPLQLLFGQALPWILVNLFALILYVLSCVWTVIRIGLWPVLFPLEILFVRPATAVLLLIYKSRYFIYFVVVAFVLGSVMGYLSSALTASPHTKATSSTSKMHSKRSKRQSSSTPKVVNKAISSSSSSSSSDENHKELPPAVDTKRKGGENTSDHDRFASAMQTLAEKRKRMGSIR